MRIAVVVRAEDGVFQPMLLGSQNCEHVTNMYRLTGCVLRRTGRRVDGPPIITQLNLTEEVIVFVNVALETVNHMFMDALVNSALDPQAGLVSGVSIDENGKVITSGFELQPDGECKDNYAGQFLRSLTFGGVRKVTSFWPYFFAVRRERLLAVGGLGILSSRRMPELLERLLADAQNSGLQAWVTPDAVATLAELPAGGPD